MQKKLKHSEADPAFKITDKPMTQRIPDEPVPFPYTMVLHTPSR
jgi:hypothetical protein